MKGNQSLHRRSLSVLFTSVLLVCLVVSSLTHIRAFSAQPPIDTTNNDLASPYVFDLDITHTITLVYGPSPYNATYIYKGEMRIGCTDIPALIGNAGRAYYKFNVHVTRLDSNAAVEILSTSVILKRTSGATSVYPNSTTILLAGGASQTVELTWGETGGGVVNYMGTRLGRTWTMGALALCTNTTAYDANPANNEIMTGGTYTAYSSMDCDANGDGVVDILDAIILSAHYGESEGDPNWNPDVNLSKVPEPSTGLQTIDIFDAIYLVRFFNMAFGQTRP